MAAIKTLNEQFKECPPIYLHDSILEDILV